MMPPAVILAGGRSSRMGGGDKCLALLGCESLIAHIFETLSLQTNGILINSNSDPTLFAPFGLPVLPDTLPGQLGPLAGLLTGMRWSRRHHPRAAHILSVPGDVPFLSPDLVARLSQSLTDERTDIAIARCPDRSHPTIGLWPVDLAERLEWDLRQANIRSVHNWLNGFRVAQTQFSKRALFNINTRADLEKCGREYPTMAGKLHAATV